MNPTTDAGQTQPRLALAIATGFGLGYLPKAPGTFGSLLGVLLGWWAWAIIHFINTPFIIGLTAHFDGDPIPPPRIPLSASPKFLLAIGMAAMLVSLLGLWAAARATEYLRKKDPQVVVVDEVAGQLISYLGVAAGPMFAVNWQYLLAGFILFRVFDIWKPFPARLAESLPGGLGIMADDWVAGVYAALALALARQLGL
jgi:phosphatidylglycerophosphatase A